MIRVVARRAHTASMALAQELASLKLETAALRHRATQWESEREKLHICIDQLRCDEHADPRLAYSGCRKDLLEPHTF